MMGLSIKTQWKTQPEKLDVPQQKKEWIIGIPRPPKEESRIPLVPSAIKVLSSLGFRFLVESKAGEKAGYSDRDLAENGADISHSREEVFGSDVILQAFPRVQTDVEFMKSGQLLIAPLHVGALQLEVLELMQKERVVGLAMEYMKDRNGSFPMVRILSELAGTGAVLQAAHWMTSQSGGAGILLGGISGVPPAKVDILGAGTVAEYASCAEYGWDV